MNNFSTFFMISGIIMALAFIINLIYLMLIGKGTALGIFMTLFFIFCSVFIFLFGWSEYTKNKKEEK